MTDNRSQPIQHPCSCFSLDYEKRQQGAKQCIDVACAIQLPNSYRLPAAPDAVVVPANPAADVRHEPVVDLGCGAIDRDLATGGPEVAHLQVALAVKQSRDVAENGRIRGDNNGPCAQTVWPTRDTCIGENARNTGAADPSDLSGLLLGRAIDVCSDHLRLLLGRHGTYGAPVWRPQDDTIPAQCCAHARRSCVVPIRQLNRVPAGTIKRHGLRVSNLPPLHVSRLACALASDITATGTAGPLTCVSGSTHARRASLLGPAPEGGDVVWHWCVHTRQSRRVRTIWIDGGVLTCTVRRVTRPLVEILPLWLEHVEHSKAGAR